MFASPVFWRELRANLKPLLIWTVVMVLLVASGMTKYTALSATTGGGASVNDLLKQMPDSLRALLGFGQLDVTSLVGYLVMLMLYFELTLALHAGLLGSGILSKEERGRTVEYLYAKPIARLAAATAKFAASLLQLVVLNLVTLGTLLAILPTYNHGPDLTGPVVALMGGVACVQVVFLLLGFALAAVLRDPRRAGAWAAGVVLAAYFLDRLAPLSPLAAVLDAFSPFSWFALADLAQGSPLGALPLAGSAAVAVVLAAASAWSFPRRDLRI